MNANVKGLTVVTLVLITLVTNLFGCSAERDALSISQTKAEKENTEIKQESGAANKTTAELNFAINDGNIYNHFFREKEVAAHTLLSSGKTPRLVVAFPAGNSGVSLWFRDVEQAIQWQEVEDIKAITQVNRDGEKLFGIEAELRTTAQELVVDQAVLSNIRVIRDFSYSRVVPKEIVNQERKKGTHFTWYRDRLDGHGGYKLSVNVIRGSVSGGDGNPVIFKAPKTGELTLKVQALTGDRPLTPIVKSNLLQHGEHENTLASDILTFLSYEEKMLAGSWRFATYFGRDTLLSIRLLTPALNSTAIEKGLGSVIERLSENGEVAHEEDVGEFAILRSMYESESQQLTPIYDYKMIDDNFMLAPIIAHYLLATSLTKADAARFLAQKTEDGRLFAQRLLDNFNFVLASTNAYAETPSVRNLIKLHDGSSVGDWRDSAEGLGNGRYPYNVNAIFVPAALKAIAEVLQSGLFDPYVTDDQMHLLSKAQAYFDVWQAHAKGHFKVEIKLQDSSSLVQNYAKKNGIQQGEQQEKLANEESLSFNGVALDDQGKAIPVMHSDDGFALLFTTPSDESLSNIVQTLLQPFPAGLLTPIGMVVANPAYANDETQMLFTNAHYHGTVIWSWQQALFAAGIERQLSRDDLSAKTKKDLQEGQCKLWQVINRTQESNNAELWSWSFDNGEFSVEPFGQRSGDKTESNAAQLWSTVYLALTAPACS